jgi:hypothetical protein
VKQCLLVGDFCAQQNVGMVIVILKKTNVLARKIAIKTKVVQVYIKSFRII